MALYTTHPSGFTNFGEQDIVDYDFNSHALVAAINNTTTVASGTTVTPAWGHTYTEVIFAITISLKNNVGADAPPPPPIRRRSNAVIF